MKITEIKDKVELTLPSDLTQKMSERTVDQDFVEAMVKALVDHPEDVRTERTVDEMGVLLTLHLNPEDMGQVIGRSGRTARALRTLLRVVGAKHNARVNLKIYEPEGSRRPMRDMRSDGMHNDGMRRDDTRNDTADTHNEDVDDGTGVDDLKL